MKRILIILPNLDLGGTETVVMNYFKNIDRGEIIFDFVVHGEAGYFEGEARELGAKIFRVPTRGQGFFKNIFAMRKIYKEENYKTVVVCTEHAFAFVEMAVARWCGVKMRGAWSHFSDYQGNSRLKRCAHFFARPFMRLFTNLFLACTEDAGRWLFGKRLQKKHFFIINNAIDLNNFEFNPKLREKIRDEFGLDENTFALGIVGRLTAVKNHAFALEIFWELRKISKKNTVLFIIGDGELRQRLETAAAEHSERKPPATGQRPHPASSVIFTGAVGNVHEFYSALDCLIIPSFHEGLTVVAIEAQAAGLPVLMSDSVSPDTKISEHATFKNFSEGAAEWAKFIKTSAISPQKRRVDLSDSGFDIKTEAQKLQKILK